MNATLISLGTQVNHMEHRLSTIATILGSKHQPGHFLSLPFVNPKENCHAIQLRSGTTYEPPEASVIRRTKGTKVKENPQDTAEHIQRSTEPHISDPPITRFRSDTPHRSAETSAAATVPYPHRLPNKKLEVKFAKFLEVHSNVHINIPLVESLQQMRNYAKFLKGVVAKKRKWGKYETVS